MHEDKQRYKNLDGIRVYACIGIIFMHVLGNGGYNLTGFTFEKLVPSFTDFTYLFMVLSAFSMSCGYYEKFSQGKIDLERFYIRRYQRIWPFFALLCTIELLIDHNINSLYEYLADVSLTFGLYANHHISVVGVGWFLGTVFVFYMIFPFFTFLLRTRKRAWLMVLTTILLHALCELRFTESIGRANFVYSAMFFAVGGLVYLYRDKLLNRVAITISVFVVAITTIVYYVIGETGIENTVNFPDYILLVLFSSLLIAGIASGGGYFKDAVSKQNNRKDGIGKHGNISLPYVYI